MMALLQFILTALLSYAGLYVGILLGVNSPEELTPGKKYFQFVQKLMFVFILLTTIVVLKDQWPSLILLLATYFFFRVIHKRWFFTLQEFYIIMAVLMFVVSKDQNEFLILTSVVFLYGLISGPLLVEPHTKHKKLLQTKRQLLYKAFSQTSNYILVLALALILLIIGTFYN